MQNRIPEEIKKAIDFADKLAMQVTSTTTYDGFLGLLKANKIGADEAMHKPIVNLQLTMMYRAFISHCEAKEVKKVTNNLGEEDLNVMLLVNVENFIRAREAQENKVNPSMRLTLPSLITDIIGCLNKLAPTGSPSVGLESGLAKINESLMQNYVRPAMEKKDPGHLLYNLFVAGKPPQLSSLPINKPRSTIYSNSKDSAVAIQSAVSAYQKAAAQQSQSAPTEKSPPEPNPVPSVGSGPRRF